jgi:hypothetical protein
MEIDGDFIIKLLMTLGGLTAFVTAFLTWNKDRLKIVVEEGALKRKEASEILEKLYTDLQKEMRKDRHDHRNELQAMKTTHEVEMLERDKQSRERARKLYSIISKKDVLIRELIFRLPPESRAVMEAKAAEIEEEITKEDLRL